MVAVVAVLLAVNDAIVCEAALLLRFVVFYSFLLLINELINDFL